MIRKNAPITLILAVLVGLWMMSSACENEPPDIHIYDENGNDLLADDTSEDTCFACHADAEYLQQELIDYPPVEPPESENAAGEG